MAPNSRLTAIERHIRSQPSTMETMAAERSKASFDPRQLTIFMDGGDENMTCLKEKIFLEIERDPTFRLDDVYDLTKEQWRERTIEKFQGFVHHLMNEPLEVFRLRMELVSLIDPGFWTRIGVHFGLFFSTLQGQATPNQLSYWVEKGAMGLNGMVGCFAMTELGHGSNVAGIETVAVFDPASDQFVINTPSLTGTKWWIGGAAHTATHASVFARLIVNGKDYGVKPFVVPLRDPHTYKLKPGVSIGDNGSKMGRNGIDNGWIQFTNVRIPRTYMLMKYTKVSREGIVKEPPLNQLAYGALIQGRVSMVIDSANVSKKALTIAIRYAAVRRQFSSATSSDSEQSSSSSPSPPDNQSGTNQPAEFNVETQLLDYTIHQHRLLPLLAQAYAMHFTGVETMRLYDDLMEKLNRLKPGDKDVDVVLAALKETHATSAGLKAFCTWNCLDTIEKCRQSCGGHGYSSYVGLAHMYNDFAVQCSWEGDNTILTLQSGRYLVSCYREAKAGKTLPGGVKYLNNIDSLLNKKCKVKQQADILDLNVIGQAYDVVSANLVKKVGEDFEQCLKRGLDTDAAYEETAISRLHAAKNHAFGYLFHRFSDGLQKAPAELKPVLTKLCALYGLYNIQENAGNFLQYGYFNSQQMDFVKSQVLELCHQIRKDAVPLVDAFNLPDFVLNSPLGRYDGDIYTHYFNKVVSRNPPVHPPPYFERLIKPLIHRRAEDQTEPEDEDDIPPEDDE
ncbi:hypothetical protein MIR68_008643 [Amoeboaphelidium protococcarum]|nr:hypothetical protein MIR68_008643 [Amoeboaphelidium protococcarum]